MALLGDENCIELRDRSHLCYKSIINYDLDITNILVVSHQVRYIEVFDITNPRFNEQIWPVPSDFVKSRFHCIWSTYRIFFRSSKKSTNVIKDKGLQVMVVETAGAMATMVSKCCFLCWSSERKVTSRNRISETSSRRCRFVLSHSKNLILRSYSSFSDALVLMRMLLLWAEPKL